MLVLTRKPAESIRIGDDVVVKVIKTGRGSVKIGIEAPDSVRVVRGELVESAEAALSPAAVVSVDPFAGVLSDQYPHVA